MSVAIPGTEVDTPDNREFTMLDENDGVDALCIDSVGPYNLEEDNQLCAVWNNNKRKSWEKPGPTPMVFCFWF
jgi:hypothetical protein